MFTNDKKLTTCSILYTLINDYNLFRSFNYNYL